MNKKGESQKNHRIQVFARCRPLNSNERKQNSPSVVEVKPEKKEIVLKERNTTREFLFDKVFPPDAKQIVVYKSVVEPLIKEVLNGYNCTVFAYGQTGTGKTYTMEGERSDSQCSWEDDPGAGIIPRSLHQLFEELNKEENVEFSVKVSFIELYNEELIDLLSSSDLRRQLRLYEDTTRKGSVIIQGLEEVIVNNKNEVYSILEKGTSRRQTAATLLNAASSRSHTVFSVTVHIKENTIDGEELLKTGKLNLVDLAGSENVGRSGAIEKRAREAGNINQSLLTLGRVITALIEKQPHIPYRESKLTRLLQDSLGGHTKTSIIATVSPALCNFDETISTLDYATKAKSITIKPEANKKMTKRALIREYTEEIEQLKKDLDAQRSKDGIYVHPDNYYNLQRSEVEQREQIKQLSDKLEALVEEKNKIEQLFVSTREELGRTCEILDETAKKYEETASELSNKKEVLAYTREVLSKTTYERDEKQYLINIHKNTEKKLSNQAQALLQVADETTSDVEKLHAKIGRKEVVENTNERLCQEFRMMLQQQFAKLDDLVSESKDEQIQGLTSIAKQSENFFLELENHKVIINSLLRGLSQEQLKCEAFSTSLNSQTVEERKLVDELQQENNSRKDQYTAEFQSFFMDVLPKHLADLEAHQTKMEVWFYDKKKLLDEKISNFNRTIEEQAEKKRELVECMKKMMQSFHAHTDQLLDKLKKQVESDPEEFDELMVAVNKAVSDNLMRYHNNIMRKKIEVKEELSNIHNCSELQIVNESLLKFDSEIKEEESNQLNLEEVGEILNVDEFLGQKESVLQTQISISTDGSKSMKHINQLIANDHEKCKKSLENLDLRIAKAQEMNDQAVNVIHSSLSRIAGDKSIEEQNTLLGGIVKGVWNFATDLISKLVSDTAKVKDEILKRDLEFEKFVSEDLVKDLPTGTTPQRKTFVYPKTLAATSPDERILQRYRSRLAADTELAISTPLDNSFNESHESKLSPIEESAKPNSDSASFFTAEDNDSAGCESDSNSSTMSDTSENYRNKENCRSDKKSRLPKRQKFLIPAPPAIRKPLFSNNSDASQ